MYSFKSRVRYSEIGYDNHLSLNGIIDYFQDCSTFQSEYLGVGIDYYKNSKRAWLLSSWQIIVNEYPQLYNEITTSTWAYDFKGIYGYRNFMMENVKGEVLAYANSIWVYIDTESGLPTRIDNFQIDKYQIEERLDMDYAPRKIAVPEKLKELEPFPVVRANIDTNKHVNNGQYVLMGQEFLPENFKIKQMRTDYRKAAKLGDYIRPMIVESKDTFVVVLADTKGNPYTTLEFKS